MTGLHTASLNPYSTGSNSNTFKPKASSRWEICLNPYSTGSNSNLLWSWRQTVTITRLNPYSTGSNSNNYATPSLRAGFDVLILILLEVTQIS